MCFRVHAEALPRQWPGTTGGTRIHTASDYICTSQAVATIVMLSPRGPSGTSALCFLSLTRVRSLFPGSCWAFSAIGAIEGAIKIVKGTLVSLSEQELVSCDTSSLGCDGGYPADAIQSYVVPKKLSTGRDYPYSNATFTHAARGACANTTVRSSCLNAETRVASCSRCCSCVIHSVPRLHPKGAWERNR